MYIFAWTKWRVYKDHNVILVYNCALDLYEYSFWKLTFPKAALGGVAISASTIFLQNEWIEMAVTQHRWNPRLMTLRYPMKEA